MRGGEVFPSRFIKVDDLGESRPVVEIDRVELVQIGGEQKPVAFFVGKTKGLPLNKTNWTTIEQLTGCPDSDDWPGHRIRLCTMPVLYQGKTVSAIRVMAAEASRPVSPRPPAAVTQAFPNVVSTPPVDDIPF